ncbi:MAG: peptidoglycan DD-metalloendopeptidase family protein [Bacteroidia bacterium]
MEIPKSEYPLFGSGLSSNDLVQIDLSAGNSFLSNIDLDDRREFENFILETIHKENGKAGIGGYLENRIIYRRSSHFAGQEAERSIHLGIDIWMPSGTKVYAPLNGSVHSFGINDKYADYGGTLILQHRFNGFDFWTLYGHIAMLPLKEFLREVGE